MGNTHARGAGVYRDEIFIFFIGFPARWTMTMYGAATDESVDITR